MGEKTTGLTRASCSTKEHIRAIGGSVRVEESSHLHAGPCQAEMAETEGAQHALCFAAPPGLAKSRQTSDAHRGSSKQIPEEAKNNPSLRTSEGPQGRYTIKVNKCVINLKSILARKRSKSIEKLIRSFPKRLPMTAVQYDESKDFADPKVNSQVLQAKLRNNVHLSHLDCRHVRLARASMKMWRFLSGRAAINSAKMLQRAPSQSRLGGTVRLRANYNNIGHLPYISNPASVGFNCTLWSSFPCKTQRVFLRNRDFLGELLRNLSVESRTGCQNKKTKQKQDTHKPAQRSRNLPCYS